jgi:hypothetical protein
MLDYQFAEADLAEKHGLYSANLAGVVRLHQGVSFPASGQEFVP